MLFRSQIFAEKYSATLAGGYENTDYTNDGGSGGSDRTDDYLWLRPGLGYEFNERINAGVFYQFRTKNSSNPGLDYSNNQLGIYTNYRF